MRSTRACATRISPSAGCCRWSACTVGRISTSPPPSCHNWRYGDDFEVANRPAAGVITRCPEEPYTTSVRTVLWEPGRATAPATRAPPLRTAEPLRPLSEEVLEEALGRARLGRS